MTRQRITPDTPLGCPFTVAVDSRESAPWTFHNIRADANKKHRPIAIPTHRLTLDTGDYSIVGLESLVTIERKSLADLFGTLAAGRDRFAAEHARMKNMIDRGGFACVVIEASLADAIKDPPLWSSLPSKVVHRTWVSWLARYRVPWCWAENRRLAELTTFRLLEKFWGQQQEREREKGQGQREDQEETSGALAIETGGTDLW